VLYWFERTDASFDGSARRRAGVGQMRRLVGGGGGEFTASILLPSERVRLYPHLHFPPLTAVVSSSSRDLHRRFREE
jgi:hypothetical protein